MLWTVCGLFAFTLVWSLVAQLDIVAVAEGRLVPSTYTKIVQPADVLEFFRDLTEAGDWHIHTAGTLRGGSRIWALASNHTEGTVVPGDRVRGNLLLATSLDGSLRTIAAMTAIRVVCANTLRLALNGAGFTGDNARLRKGQKPKDAIAISHRSTFDPEAVKRELGVARPAFEVFMNQARAMADVGIGTEEARKLLNELFGKPAVITSEAATISGGSVDGSDFAQLLARPHVAEDAADKEAKDHRNTGKVLELFGGKGRGADHPGVKGTRWGLFNAITEFVDHESGRTQGTRLDNAWFGKGQDMKAEALRLLSDGTYAPAANNV